MIECLACHKEAKPNYHPGQKFCNQACRNAYAVATVSAGEAMSQSTRDGLMAALALAITVYVLIAGGLP